MTRTVRLTAEFDNPDEALKPGMFLSVGLEVTTKDDAVVVPEEAVVSEGLRQLVYPVKDNKVERRVIRIGQRQGGKVEVVEGLSPARPSWCSACSGCGPAPDAAAGRHRRAAPRRHAAPAPAPAAQAEAGAAAARRTGGSLNPVGGRAPAPRRGTGASLSRAGEALVRTRVSHAGFRPLHPPSRLRRRGEPSAHGRRPRLADAPPRARISGGGPPVVSVSTVYRGASNEVIESRVTEIIEGAVAGIEGIRQITSQSQNDRSSVSIEFDVSRNPEAATSDVRDAVSRVIGRLPDGADRRSSARSTPTPQAIMWIGVTSETLDSLELSDFLKRVYVDRLSTVPGVANVYIGGERRYAMRIWVDRPRAGRPRAHGAGRRYGDQAAERRAARRAHRIRAARAHREDRLAPRSTPEEFEQVIVSNKNGYLVRLGEVARVEVGAEDNRFEFYHAARSRSASASCGSRPPTRCRWPTPCGRELEKLLEGRCRPARDAEVLYDESHFIRASINGVLKTLARRHRPRHPGHPALPARLALDHRRHGGDPGLDHRGLHGDGFFGASINVLTLLAIVLAIGIVVDDAIVEIENVHRRIEEGQPPLLAAFDGAREIGFAVIATTATLMAVFVPLAFMTGNTGRLFREFAITLAAAIFFSGVVARTLTPMMCSKLMVPAHGRIQRWTEPVFERHEQRLSLAALARPCASRSSSWRSASLVSFSAYDLFQVLPKEFAPTEDRGVIIVRSRRPRARASTTPATGCGRSSAPQPLQEQGIVSSMLSQVAPGFAAPLPGQCRASSSCASSPGSSAIVKQQEVVQQLLPRWRTSPARAPSRSTRRPSGQGGFGPADPVRARRPRLRDPARVARHRHAEGAGDRQFVNLDSDYTESQPDLRVQIDRQRAADLGVSVEDIGARSN